MNKTLEQVLPYEFGLEFDDTQAYKFKDVRVIKKHDAREKPWPGTHKNITYWWELANGYAVGMNENLARGWSFPVIKLK